MTSFSSFEPRIRLSPYVLGNPDLSIWLRDVMDALNAIPPISSFSYSNPNSNLSATRGTLGVNSNSNVSVFWVKQVGSGNTGWVALA